MFICNYKNNQDRLILNGDIQLVNLLLEEHKTQLSGYVKIIAKFPGLLKLEENNLYKRKIFSLQTELYLKGINIYDNQQNSLFKIGTGFDFMKNSKNIKKIYKLVHDGYTTSFFSDTELFDLQINAASGIYDEYNLDVTGVVLLNDFINKEDLQLIAQKYDLVIQYFKKSHLEKTNKKLLDKIGSIPGKDYYIERKIIKEKKYLIGYLPIKDFYNETLGYFTILKPQVTTYYTMDKIILIIIVGFAFLLLIIYLYNINATAKKIEIRLL